jgi:hypothetical protein
MEAARTSRTRYRVLRKYVPLNFVFQIVPRRKTGEGEQESLLLLSCSVKRKLLRSYRTQWVSETHSQIKFLLNFEKETLKRTKVLIIFIVFFRNK